MTFAAAALLGHAAITTVASAETNWTTQDIANATSTLRSVAYINSSWIAEGSDNTIYTSTTMAGPWSSSTLPDSTGSDAIYSSSLNKWLFAENAGKFATTADPTTNAWTSLDSGVNTNFQSIATDGTNTVAVGVEYNGQGTAIAGDILTSTDWSQWSHPVQINYGLNKVIYANGEFVAVGDHGSIYTSSDAVTWTKQVAPVASNTPNPWDPYDLKAITYGNGQFVAVGTHGTILTSPNGQAWTLVPSTGIQSGNQDFTGVAYGAGKYVAVTNNASTSSIVSSVDDGATWSTEGTFAGSFASIAYASGYFAAAGFDSSTHMGALFSEPAITSNNANLIGLTVNPAVTLSPSFSYTTTNYSAQIPSALTKLDVTPTLADGTASVTVNGLNATSGNAVSIPVSGNTSQISVVVTAQDGTTKTYAVNLTHVNPPVITTTTLPGGSTGQAYTQTLVATGKSPFQWTLQSGALPAGLTLSSGGAISGTPTAAGSSSFTVQVQDATGLVATRSFTIAVSAGPSISGTTLPSGVVGTWYSQQLSGTGTTPLKWSINSGVLPSGLTLSTTGLISGYPTIAGTKTFTVNVTDANNASTTMTFTMVVNAPPTITTTTIPDGVVGQSYIQQLAGTGSGALQWSVTGGWLPSGITLNSNGALWGTPTQAGTWSFQAQVTDASGLHTVKLLTVKIDNSPVINTTTLPTGAVGVPYQQTLSGTGATTGANLQWSVVSGSLPSGLVLSSYGSITGSPRLVGTSTFSVQMLDNTNHVSITRSMSLSVVEMPKVVTTALHQGYIGQLYSTALTASGSSNAYQWTLVSGTLPTGLSLSSNGAISGIPTTQQTSYFTVQVTDSFGLTAKANLTLTVGKPLYTIHAQNLSRVVRTQTFAKFSLSASGGHGPYVWSLSQGSLPTGMHLESNGVIYGAPTQHGLFTCTVHVKDAYGVNQTIAVSVKAIPKNQVVLKWKSTEETVPFFVRGSSTYVPMWYISHVLKVGGITLHWNGKNLYLTSSRSRSHVWQALGSGRSKIYVNGKLTKRVNVVAAVDPYSKVRTAYIPIQTMIQALSALGVHGSWDSLTWTVD